MSETKILVLDRDIKNRTSTSQLLREKGFAVSTSSTEKNLYQLLSELNPNLILLNPSENGYEISKSLKQNPQFTSIPLLQITNPPSNDNSNNFESYADGFLLTPVEPIELVTNIKALVRLSRTQQEGKLSGKAEQFNKEITTYKAIEEKREREQRLNLAISIAELGTWNFNLLTNELETSTKQATLFGYRRHKKTRTPDEWRLRIHPDDRGWVEQRLRDAVAGVQDYDVEYRIVWPDKTIHWVTSKAKLLLDEHKQAVRLIGVTCDITTRKQREQALESLLECAKQSGKKYFESLVQALAESFQVRYAFIAEIEPARPTHAKMIAYYADNQQQSTITYDLQGTPSQKVIDQGLCFYPVGAAKLFPHDELLIRLKVEGYLGTPLKNSEGTVIGVIAVMHDKPISDTMHPLSLLRMFAGQASVTMERERAEIALRDNEEQLRLVMEAANIGTWDWNFANDYSRWGGMHNQLFGLPEEKQGATFNEFLSMIIPDDRPLVEQATFRSVHEDVEYKVEFRILHPDGQIRWMQDQGQVYHEERRAVRLMGIVQDITDRKQFEEQLRNSEEQLRLTTTGVGVGMWFWNLQTDELIWTETCKALFGLSPDTNMSYQVFLNALHPADREYTNAAVRSAIDEGTEYNVEFRTVWPDNSVHWISARGNVTYDDVGKPLKMTGVTWDITNRKETEFALQASEQRYRALVQASSQTVWSIDEKGQGEEAAKWWAQLTGMDEEASRNGGWLNALHPDDRERAKTAWQQSRENFKGFHTEYRVRDSQGIYRYLSIRGVPIWNADSTFREWVGTITDITDRKRDEITLRDSNAILTAINQSTEDLIFVKDLEGRFLLINPAFALLLGKAESDIIGKTDRQLLVAAEVERIRESDSRVLYSGKTEIVEESLSLMKGTRTYLSTKSPYLDEHGTIIGLICISTDITNRKRAEKEREQLLKSEQAAREEAQAANHAKDEFLAVVSHELRAPLNAMLGWTRILQSKEIDESTQQRALETIERSARMQAQIIEDLLDTARIISGKLKLEVRSVHLIPVINSALEIMRPAAAAKQLDIDLQVNSESDLITGDAERLQQVIWNLLSNAIKFNRTGGKVTIILQRVDPYMQVVVRDTGKGIDAGLLPFIFDRFYQADNSSKRRAGGLGLGLALVRQLVELHGGTITAESAGEDQGATFTVNLPIRAIRAQTATLQSPFATVAKDQEALESLEGLWVLVVDDEADARDLLTVLLQRYGAKVTSAASAEEALNTIIEGEADRRPDVIVSDIGMPEQDGYLFMRRVRSLAPQYGGMIPAVAVTAYGQPSDRIQALTAGFQSHIPKPVEADELRMVIANLTGRAIRGFSS